MNKRHTGKMLAFFLAVVFMFTLIPQVMAAGEENALEKNYLGISSTTFKLFSEGVELDGVNHVFTVFGKCETNHAEA